MHFEDPYNDEETTEPYTSTTLGFTTRQDLESLLPRWWVVPVNTIKRKTDFVGNYKAESTG